MPANLIVTLESHLKPLYESRVAFAVSAGIDSVTLFHASSTFFKNFKYPPLLFHIIHGLRPEAEYWESLFLKRLSHQYRIKFFEQQIDLSSNIKKTVPEEKLREERLKCLFKLAKDSHIKVILTGHQQCDLEENFLIRLFQGSDVFGLSALKPHSFFKKQSILIQRPFLDISKKQIHQYCAHHALCYYEDQSNSSNLYQRNYLRNQLIPSVEKHFKRNIKKTLLNTAKRHEQISEELDIEAINQAKKLCYITHNTLWFHFENWKKIRYFWKDLIIRFILLNHLQEKDGLKKSIRRQLIQYIESSHINGTLFKRPHWLCHVEYGQVLFQLKKKTEEQSMLPFSITPFNYTAPLKETLKHVIQKNHLQVFNLKGCFSKISLKPYNKNFVFYPSRLKGQFQTVEHFLNKKNYPHLWRSQLPILVDEQDNVIAIVSIDVSLPFHASNDKHDEKLVLIQYNSNTTSLSPNKQC